MAARTVAVFDFDGTLTKGDTLVPFLTTLAGRAAVLGAFARDPLALALGAARLGDRDAAKERVLTRVLRGRSYDDLRRVGTQFAQRLASAGITADARERIEQHRRAGHSVVIASASLDVYLSDVAHALGVEQLLCSRLEIDDAGRCTGRLLGANCRGAEKAARVRALLTDDDVEVWAYGNSRDDDAMLALAHHPVRVKRGRFGALAPSGSR